MATRAVPLRELQPADQIKTSKGVRTITCIEATVLEDKVAGGFYYRLYTLEEGPQLLHAYEYLHKISPNPLSQHSTVSHPTGAYQAVWPGRKK